MESQVGGSSDGTTPAHFTSRDLCRPLVVEVALHVRVLAVVVTMIAVIGGDILMDFYGGRGCVDRGH